MRVLRIVIAFAAIALLAAPASAGESLPPAPKLFVTDNASALSDATRAAIESELQTYEKATGHQILVYIDKTTGDVPLEQWTVDAANHWKAGRKGHDDGAVLFMFMQDHKIRIEVGYGLEGSLPDATAKQIIDEQITPQMKAGNTDAAVTNGVAAILGTVTPSFKLTSTPAPDVASGDMNPVLGFLIFGLVALMGLLFVGVWAIAIFNTLRYGYLVLREGGDKARKDMAHAWFWGGVGIGSGGGWSSGGGGGGFSGGFSGGGGSFGGGGASGGW